jgi:hypothetical protein
MDPDPSNSWMSNVVIRKPLRTKKISTPIKPPFKRPEWKPITASGGPA